MRGVRRAGGEIEEERLLRSCLLLVLNEANRPVREVLGEVVTLLRRARRGNRSVVADQRRRPLIGVAAQEAVIALETEPERPAVERSGRAELPPRCQMPFSDGERAVSRIAQNAGECRRRPRNLPVVPGKPDRYVTEKSHADRVMVA